MDKYPVLLDGAAAGELTAKEAGMYVEFWAACRAGEPGLLRAYLVGEQGETLLGVLAPEGGGLSIRRRLSRRETADLGKLLRCEARRSGGRNWEPAASPEALLTAPFFKERLRSLAGVLTRTENGRRYVAALCVPDKPFPLPTLFCFARIREINGKRYAVFAFDEKETPVLDQGRDID